MTTPDKEEIPKDRTAGPWIVHYGEAVKIKDANGYTVASLSQIHLHGRRSKNEVEKTARFIVIACNAYEPMREALAFYAAPENHGLQQHGLCFASAVDIDEGERARAALSTLPVNDRQTSDDAGRLREALERLTFEVGCLRDGCGGDALKASWQEARAALKGVPQPASNDYQADAGAPALSEKVNARLEWRPIESAPADGTEILAYMPGFALGQMVLYWQDDYWREKANSMGLKYPPTHWMPLPSPPGAELNFSDDAGSDAVRLKPDTSSQPASEAGKLSTDEVTS